MVVDASAFVELLLHPQIHPQVRAIVGSGVACAPALFDAEVLANLVKKQKHGAMTPDRVRRSIDVLIDTPIERVPHAGLLRDAWLRSAALSGYDALYVALAAQRGLGLVTADRRLAGAPKLGISLTLISAS